MRTPSIAVFMKSVGMCAALSAAALGMAAGADTSQGQLTALKAVKPLVVDGNVTEWNLSAMEGMALALGNLTDGVARYAASYDETGLNLVVDVKDATPMRNLNDGVQKPGWKGDAVILLLDAKGNGKKDEVTRITLWYNSAKQKALWEMDRGAVSLLDKLPGMAVAFKQSFDGEGYLCEAHLPWAALGLSAKPEAKSSLSACLQVQFSADDATAAPTRVNGLLTGQASAESVNQPALWGAILFGGEQLTRPAHATLDEMAKSYLVTASKLNGSFESDALSPWYDGYNATSGKPLAVKKSTLKTDPAFANDGKACLVLQASGDADGKRSAAGAYLNVNNVDVNAGRKFTVTCDLRNGATNFSGFHVEFLSMNKDKTIGFGKLQPGDNLPLQSDRWVTNSYAFVLPDTVTDINFVQLRLVFYQDGGAATTVFEGLLDNVTLQQAK